MNTQTLNYNYIRTYNNYSDDKEMNSRRICALCGVEAKKEATKLVMTPLK